MSSLLANKHSKINEGVKPHRRVNVRFQKRNFTNLPAGLFTLVSSQDEFINNSFHKISLVREGWEYRVHVPPSMVSAVEYKIRREHR